MTSNVVQVRFSLKGSPTLQRFRASDTRRRLLVGPFGSGKSSVCVMEILKRADQAPVGRHELDEDGNRLLYRRSRFIVVRNTYRELEDTTRKTFEQWVPRVLRVWRAQDKFYLLRWGDPTSPQGAVESEVLFRALDQPEDVKKLLSLELTGAYINEAREVPKGAFDTLDGRIGRYPAMKDLPDGSPDPWCGIWMDTNPPDTDHWLFTTFEEEKPSGHELFHQPSGRGPDAENRANIPSNYYDVLTEGKDQDFISVNVDSKYGFVREGKPVYPEFNDNIHVQEHFLGVGDITLGQDFGLTPAAVLVQRDPTDGQLQVVDELVGEDIGAARFFKVLSAMLKSKPYGHRGVNGFGDPAGEQRAQTDEQTPFQIAWANGVVLAPAPTNDFTLRREAVAGLLTRLTIKGRPAMVIHPRCKVLRKAMAGGYAYRRVLVAGTPRYEDKPLKNRFSHVAEALQYAVVGLGEDARLVSPGRSSGQRGRGVEVVKAYNGG